jgi:hypothetical protein
MLEILNQLFHRGVPQGGGNPRPAKSIEVRVARPEIQHSSQLCYDTVTKFDDTQSNSFRAF